jgi:hypothetical protein
MIREEMNISHKELRMSLWLIFFYEFLFRKVQGE